MLIKLAKLYQSLIKEKDKALRHTLRRIVDVFYQCANLDSSLKDKLASKGCIDVLIQDMSHLPGSITLYVLKCIKLVTMTPHTIEFLEKTKLLQELSLILQNRGRSQQLVRHQLNI